MKSKKWFEIFIIILICGTITITCNFNDDDETNESKKITIDGWTWSASNDKGDGGISTITMTQGADEDDKKITIKGNVSKVLDVNKHFGYVDLQGTPNNTILNNLKTADGIKFGHLGDGKKYVVEVRTSDIEDLSHYRYILNTLNQYSPLTILYEELQTPGWGESQNIPFDKNNITTINFQATWEDTLGGNLEVIEGPYELTVWNLTPWKN